METATQDNAMTENAGSVPAQEVEGNAVIVESASTTEVPAEQNTEVEGAEPSKAVKELIAQRKKRQEAERQAAYWEGVAKGKGFENEGAKPVIQPQAPEIPVAPKLDDFETYEEFDAAKDVYYVAKAKYEFKQELQSLQQQQQAVKVQQTFWEKVASEEASDPMIRETITNVGRNVSPLIADLVIQSDIGVDLARHLERNLNEARRISSLPPILAAKELGILEAQLRSKPAPEPPKKVSSAPTPIQTVTPTGATVTDEDDLPLAEYIKRKNQAQYGKN